MNFTGNLTGHKELSQLIASKNYNEAATLIEEQLEKDPMNPDPYYFLGVVHYFKGNIPGAIESLKTALDRDPRHTDAAVCLSVVYNDIGKYDEARKIFEKANHSVRSRNPSLENSIDQKFSIKHVEIGDLYMRYKRFDEAVDEYTKASILSPLDSDIRIRIAKAFAKKGYSSRAIQELQRLKSQNPKFIPALLQLGLLYYSQGNILDAELEWEYILSIDENHNEARQYLQMAKTARESS